MGHKSCRCSVIDCITTEAASHHGTGAISYAAGATVWHSHMDASTYREHRLSADNAAEDHRGSEPDPVTVTESGDDCKAHPPVAFIFALSAG
jgi:hypothetical protein